MRSSDFILVDFQAEAVDVGSKRLLNRVASIVHHAVHVARPNVNCAAHSHDPYGHSFCTLRRPIYILTHDACAFYKTLSGQIQSKGVLLA
jgi:ribulose-5-phosphate 4-epimerase/fuculose-1-phosphate aldolase